jgi:putative membrane protein
MRFIITTLMFLFPFISLADEGDGCQAYQGGYGMMNSFGLGSFGIFFNFIFWIVIILLTAYAVKMFLSSKNLKEENALNILKGRYAKGELNKKEFEEKKKEIM